MTKGTITGLAIAGIAGIAGILGIIALIGFGGWLSAANEGARLEGQIEAVQTDNRQVLGAYTNTIREMVGVTNLQSTNLERVTESALTARYGEQGSQGSQGVLQFVQENYPGQIDNQLYRNIQIATESGRTRFANNQTRLIDIKRVYTVKLNQPISGFWLKLAGYPKTDLSKIQIVSSDAANRAFETGVDNGIEIK